MTEKQIEYGFWHWDKTNNFPPDSITYPHEYKGQVKLNIACSQILDMTPTQQKKLVNEWVDVFQIPFLHKALSVVRHFKETSQ